MVYNLIFLGPPGSGKGTIGALLAKDLSIPHISTGEILRTEISSGTELGVQVKEIVASGALVDDELVAKIIDKRIKQEDCSQGFILDGYPRTLNQARLLQKIFADQSKELTATVLLNVPDDVLILRLSGRRKCDKCGKDYNINTLTPPKVEGVCDDCGGSLVQRKDDNPETIKNRLNLYREETEPLIQHYKEQGALKEIKAGNSIEDNLRMVKESLGA